MRLIQGIALDGGICAGKSTVKQALLAAHGYQPVSEFMEMLTTEETTDAFGLEARRTIDLFVIAEERRLAQILNQQALYCLDRSFLTLAAYRYAAVRIGLIDSDELTYSAAVIARSKWLTPPAFIFLDVPHALRQARSTVRDAQKNMPFPLLDEEFNVHFSAFFQHLQSQSLLKIVSNAGTDHNLSGVVAEILTFSEAASTNFAPERLRTTAISLMLGEL